MVHGINVLVKLFGQDQSTCCDVRDDFFSKNDVRFVLTPICFVGGSCLNYLCYLYLFTYTGVPHDVHIR